MINFPAVQSSPFPQFLLSDSSILSLQSPTLVRHRSVLLPWNERPQVSHPYKTTNEITVLYAVFKPKGFRCHTEK